MSDGTISARVIASPASFRASLQHVASLANEVDAVFPSHGPSPISPSHVIAIHDAFEQVWGGRLPERHGSLYGHPIAVYDFGGFSFLLPPEGPRQTPTS